MQLFYGLRLPCFFDATGSFYLRIFPLPVTEGRSTIFAERIVLMSSGLWQDGVFVELHVPVSIVPLHSPDMLPTLHLAGLHGHALGDI